MLVCVISLFGCDATCPAGTTASGGKCVRGGTGPDGEDTTSMSVEGNPQGGEGGARTTTNTGTSGSGASGSTAGKPGQRTGGNDASSSQSGAGGKLTTSSGGGGQSGNQAGKTGSEGGNGTAANGGMGGGNSTKSCQVGATRCADGAAEVQVCTASGNWMSKEVCDGVCSDGACAGVCKPETLHCGTNQTVEKCNDQGVWTPGEKCPNVCSGAGVCSGDCKPGSKRCGGSGMLTEQMCDETGTWQDVRTCPNLCSGGSCGGSCMPGARQCRTETTPEECSPMGTWEAEPECPAVCGEGGQCTGDCKPGLKDCAGQTPTKCEGGRWVNQTPCVDKACVNGVCGGTCTPGTFRCGTGNAKQRCNEKGAWVLEKQCPFACTNNDCSGTCVPGTKMCASTTMLNTCRMDASGYDASPCVPAKNETASCETNACVSKCVAPANKCGTQYCYKLDYGCDTCKFPNVWRDATTTPPDHVCVVPESRTTAANENNANPKTPCPAGDWVPRAINASDNVCVTQARKNAIVAENANAVNTAVVSSGTPP